MWKATDIQAADAHSNANAASMGHALMTVATVATSTVNQFYKLWMAVWPMNGVGK